MPDGWISLFNGKDMTGWKLKSDSYTVTRYVDAGGTEIKGGKETKLDQKTEIQDAKGKPIAGAKVAKIDKKDVIVDAEGKPIPGAKTVKVGGRTAIVDAKGAEVKDARKVQETVKDLAGGWKVENGELTCKVGPRGVDLLTKEKFSDLELHVEFKGTSNSGVYLQGRYEIQIDNSFNVKPRIEEKDGKKVETLPKTMCGALYGQVAPSSFGKDFQLKLEFRASLKSDSGVYVRGPQLQVRDYIPRNERPQLKGKFKDDDWNSLDITVKAGVVVSKVNGKDLTASDVFELSIKNGQPTAKLNGKDVDVKDISVKNSIIARCYCNSIFLEDMVVPAAGGIGLQAETGKFEFRNIRIKELP